MRESLVITWGASRLKLNRMPAAGHWDKPENDFLQIELQRPTRTDRLAQIPAKEALKDCLNELMDGIPLDVPVWFLIPRSWAIIFNIPTPGFHDDEDIREHLLWEAKQRLHGEVNAFSAIYGEPVGESVQLIAIRNEIIDTLREIARQLNFEIAGIGVEPENNWEYSLDGNWDLKKSTPVDVEEAEFAFTRRSINFFGYALAGVIAVLIIFIIINLTKSPEVSKPEYKVAEATKETDTKKEVKGLPATDTVTETDEPELDLTSPDYLVTESDIPEQITQKQPEQQSSAYDATKSSFSSILDDLPPGGQLRFAVITPLNMRMEFTGIGNPNSWVSTLRYNPKLTQLSAADIFSDASGRQTTILELPNPGINTQNRVKNATGWKSAARSNGLTVKDLQADGNYRSCISLIESLWDNPMGYEKIYFKERLGNSFVLVQ